VGIAQANDPPSIQLPASPSLTEDLPAMISGITVSDPEDGTLTVSLAADSGSVVPDLVVGTPAQINTALAALEYTPAEDYSGPAAIDISVADDPHFVLDQLVFTIDPAVPAFSLPPVPPGTEDQDVVIDGISLSDVDGLINVGLAPSSGSVVPSDLFGDAASVNATLAQIVYTPDEDYSGPVTIDLIAVDGPHFVPDQLVFTIDPAAPQIQLPSPPSLPPDTVSAIPGISVSDIDGNVNISLSVSTGTVDPVDFSGPASAANSALAALSYTPPAEFLGPVVLDIGVSDGPHFVSSQLDIAVVEVVQPVPALGRMGLAITSLLLVGVSCFALRSRSAHGAGA
jgi:hypothetical protein